MLASFFRAVRCLARFAYWRSARHSSRLAHDATRHRGGGQLCRYELFRRVWRWLACWSGGEG